MFYDNLLNICEEKGLKLTKIVVECGGASGSINGWKKGAMPNSGIVMSLSERLNVSTDYLLFGRDKEYKNAISISNGIELQAIQLFNALPETEQLKLIGRMELLLEQYKNDDFEEAGG